MIIDRIENFVSNKELAQLEHLLSNGSAWRFNRSHWRYYLFKDLMPYNQYDTKSWYHNSLKLLQELPPTWEQLFNSVFDLAGPNFCLMRYAINGQTQNQEPSMHVDVTSDVPGTYRTYLIYLNAEWHQDWGGATEFANGNTILHREWPEPGKLISYNSKMQHVGRPPLKPDLLRLSIALQGKLG